MALQGNRCLQRWKALLFLLIVALVLASCWCYDPCPESLRRSAKPFKIPESGVEKAFQEAEAWVAKRKETEKQLVEEGRVVNKEIKSPDSTHQQANVPPEVREMESRQLVFQKASEILTERYNLSPEDVSCGLPKLELKEASAAVAVQQCVNNQAIQCDPLSKYRTMDGTCNNLDNPRWGSALECFRRMLTARYGNGGEFRRSVTGVPLPEPRELSLNIHNHLDRPSYIWTNMFMFFGQLLDHDITLTAQSTTVNNEPIQCCPMSNNNHPQCAAIAIPSNDSFYGRYNVRCLNFVRSALCPYCTAGPRTQINVVTAYIDCSFVYGNSLNESNNLRESGGRGMLLRMQNSQYGPLLPPSDNPRNDQCSNPDQGEMCFQAGDIRANQHPGLISLHTLFFREHNRLAVILRRLNPRWNNETCFQEARKILIAQMQVIVYKEYMPIVLGDERMTYFKLWPSKEPTYYNKYEDATLYTDFSTAAFRFGHSLISSMIEQVPPPSGSTGSLLRDLFFQPFGMYSGQMNSVLRGSTKSPSQQFDRHMVPDVTNFLYRTRGNATGSDLASFNIQRGRDHGLQPYVEYVYFCSEKQIRVQSFSDLVYFKLMSQTIVTLLQRFYRHVGDIDLFTGILCETPDYGAAVGATGRCIIGIQFWKLKYGDRFYFQHEGEPCSFTKQQRAELMNASLSRMICDNTQITEIQKNAMLYDSYNNNPCVSCKEIPSMNLNAWKQ